MANILQLTRRLESRPEISAIPNVVVRNYAGDQDLAPWLELRNRAFAKLRLGVRTWTADDFRGEFTSRWWWQPSRMWLAESVPPESADGTPPQLLGAVALAMRGEPDQARPVVHWLIVLPAWRRRGIARLLMAHLETAAWDAGHRQLWLETHAAWEAAAKFYEASGYRPAEF